MAEKKTAAKKASSKASEVTSSPQNKSVWEKAGPLLLLILVGGAFFIGSLWQKVQNLESGNPVRPAAVDNNGNAPSQPSSGKLSEAQAKNLPQVNDADHVRGNRDAEVFLIEYSDFECPFCARFHPTTQQVLDEYGDSVALVYRHFPLESLHPRAREAAIGSECVAELGGEEAFWSYVDAVFENQTLALSDLTSVATDVGVNGAAFESCVDAEKYNDLVDQQYGEGAKAGVTGTPGNFIMNKKGEVWLIPGAVPFEQLKTAIDEALAS